MPLTIEGASVLHQMFRIRWPEWKRLPEAERASILQEAAEHLGKMEQATGRQSAAYSLLGHKGDLLLVHFRHSFEELSALETELAQLRLFDFLDQTSSYVSVVELGLYESTVKTYESLLDDGVVPDSEEWEKAVEEVLARQREAMRARLYPDKPAAKYACF